MAVNIALDDEEMQRRMQQVAPLAQMPTPAGAPVQPSTMDQAKAMGTQMVLEKGLEAGMAKATPLVEAGLAKGTSALTGAGMGAGVATAVPYIGAGLLAGKALGLFSNGGRVGPLYAADGKMAYPSYRSNYSDLSDAEILKLSPEEQDEYIKTIGIEEAMDAMYNYKGGRAGPLSKVEYKSAGGEVYKLSYGGPISKGV